MSAAMSPVESSKKPARILHIFSTFDVGGPQVRFAQLANAWGKDYAHTIVAMDNKTAAAQQRYNQTVLEKAKHSAVIRSRKFAQTIDITNANAKRAV